jgi:hypothetical protein
MMAKRKTVFKMVSYGEYEKWDRDSPDIPHILNFTTRINAEPGTEFGYVLHIKQAKNETITFRIDHPPFTDEKGEIVPPFEGEQFIHVNHFQFYLGDCVWEPVEDKLGTWELTTFFKGKVVAHKAFELVKK